MSYLLCMRLRLKTIANVQQSMSWLIVICTKLSGISKTIDCSESMHALFRTNPTSATKTFRAHYCTLNCFGFEHCERLKVLIRFAPIRNNYMKICHCEQGSAIFKIMTKL